jgi:hypothetical protein
MLIKDLRFIEETDTTDNIHGGASAFTGVSVSANGGTASAGATAKALGDSTVAGTVTGTRSAKGAYYAVSAAAGGAAAAAVTLNGRKPIVATSVTTGFATDIKLT